MLTLENIAVGYKGKPVAESIHMHAYKGDRIAIIGPNGIGKSTLLKTIVKRQEPITGTIRYGTNVQFGYYDQNQATILGTGTVLHELWDEWPMMNEKDVRSVLGRFLFTGEDVDKPVVSLSGGEKARLSLAKLMLQKSNTLILDEPTNHLDLDSKEVLENALDDFPGTILFVSHDRYFINRIATKVIDVGPKGVTEYLGDYDYFIEKKNELEELKAEHHASERPVQPKNGRNEENKEFKRQERRLTRAIAEIEASLGKMDAELAGLQEELLNPDFADDHVKLMELQRQIDELQLQHDSQSEDWLNLQEELEELNAQVF